MVGPRTELIDASGCTLVPGYIEPHAHPWNLDTPAALARHVLPLGTTTLFGDNLTAYELGGLRGFETAADFRPAVRLTSVGVWDVRRRRVVWPSRPRR